MDSLKEMQLKAHWITHLQAEYFGEVRPHQRRALNYHLHIHVKGFDEEYEKCGGKLASTEHFKERLEFTKLVAEDMIKNEGAKPKGQRGNFNKLSSETTFESASTNSTMIIRSYSTIGSDLKGSPSRMDINYN